MAKTAISSAGLPHEKRRAFCTDDCPCWLAFDIGDDAWQKSVQEANRVRTALLQLSRRLDSMETDLCCIRRCIDFGWYHRGSSSPLGLLRKQISIPLGQIAEMDPHCPLCQLMISSGRSPSDRCCLRFNNWKTNSCLYLKFYGLEPCQMIPSTPSNVNSYIIGLTKIAEDLEMPTAGTKLISGRTITTSVNFTILKKFLAATEPSKKPSRQLRLWHGLQKDTTPESWAYRAWDRDNRGRKSQGKEYSQNATYPFQYQKRLRGPSIVGIDFRLINVRQECLVSATAHTRYIALSYVWGNLERTYLRNCKANFKEPYTPRAIRYNDSEVPRTVRDAIITTKNLGYKFLWVDTLCIIQDDVSDKRDPN